MKTIVDQKAKVNRFDIFEYLRRLSAIVTAVHGSRTLEKY